jgi:hypothetical protein
MQAHREQRRWAFWLHRLHYFPLIIARYWVRQASASTPTPATPAAPPATARHAVQTPPGALPIENPAPWSPGPSAGNQTQLLQGANNLETCVNFIEAVFGHRHAGCRRHAGDWCKECNIFVCWSGGL